MSNDASMEGGPLIGIQVMTAELATSHAADRMDEVRAVKVFKPVLVQVVGVGTMIEVVSRRVLPTLFVTCIL